jgi:tetratricopeptide (TPR) repeat protein
VTELQALEQLFTATAPSSPDRPTLARRLAEDYAELRRAALADGKRELASKASSKAIESYELLAAQYPKYPKLDDVMYEQGLEREQGGDVAGARKSYLELLLKVPTSPLVPLTYAALGELFFAEAAGDPQKLRLAQQAYEKVLGHPPPENRAYGLAHLRLAEIAAKTGDDPRALKELKSAIEFGMQYPELPGAAELTRVARKELVASYARVGAADAVYPFFKAMMGDGALDAMMDLADGYVKRGQAKDAFLVLSEVLRRDQGHSCERAPRVQRASDAAKDQSGVGQLDLERLARITTAMCAGK